MRRASACICFAVMACLAAFSHAFADERIAYLREKDRSLWIENLDGINCKQLATDLGNHQYDCLDLSPDGKTVAVWHPDRRLGTYLVDLSSPDRTRYLAPASDLIEVAGTRVECDYYGWAEKPNEIYIQRLLLDKSDTLHDGGMLILNTDTMKTRVLLNGDPYRSPCRQMLYSPDGARLVVLGEEWLDVLDSRTHRRLAYLTSGHDEMDAFWLNNVSLVIHYTSGPGDSSTPAWPIILDTATGKHRRWPYRNMDLRQALFCNFDHDKNVVWSMSQRRSRIVVRKELNLKTKHVTTRNLDSMDAWYSRTTDSGYVVKQVPFDLPTGGLWIIRKSTGQKRLVANDVVSYEIVSD